MSLRGRSPDWVGEVAAAQADDAVCQSCGRLGMVAFYEATGVPTQTCVLLDTRTEARAFPLGEVLLVFCEGCGFIQNARFDPSLMDYSMPTEESQAFSPTFTAFASQLADELVRDHGLGGKTVLEVGCGKGDFLVLLAERGIARGYGIDPGFLPDRSGTSSSALEFARDWYGPEHTHLTADMVITRHLMEHVPNVAEFFGWLRTSVTGTEGSSLFTEVPDAERVLREGAFWDVYYEHCSYFTIGSLERSLTHAGFEVEWIRTGFEDQYLLAGAIPSGSRGHRPEWDAGPFGGLVESFAASAGSQVRRWRSRLAAVVDQGGTVAVWGGGSKAVAFLAAVNVKAVTVVDINPHKQGKWLPGVGVEVQPPQSLAEHPPDLVVPMNPAYSDEINADLRAMGIDTEVISVHPR